MADSTPDPDATRDSWKKVLPIPETRVPIGFTASYCTDDFRRIKRGLIPRQMEDKWFIFFEEPWLYFHRSWTGRCIYGVQFGIQGSKITAIESWASRDPAYKETNIEYDRAILTFLIEALLLGRLLPFPVRSDLPSGLPSGAFQHNIIGRGYREKKFDVGGTGGGTP